MKDFIKLFICVYFISSFILGEFNFINWGFITRLIFVVLIFSIYTIENEKDN